MKRASLAALLVLITLAAAASADEVYSLAGGDRVSGKTLLETKKAFRVRTAYGILNIPRDKVLTRQKEDGTVETVTAAPVPSPSPSPTPAPAARLAVVFTGSAFWQAWEPRMVPADTRLRLHLEVDDRPLADYLDGTLDPDLPGAVVNTFSLVAGDLQVKPAEGVRTERPTVKTGEARLALELPADIPAGEHRLRIAYQADGGSPDAPAWQDRVAVGVSVQLEPARTTTVTLRQDRGSMEYSKKKMKGVETFVLETTAVTTGP